MSKTGYSLTPSLCHLLLIPLSSLLWDQIQAEAIHIEHDIQGYHHNKQMRLDGIQIDINLSSTNDDWSQWSRGPEKSVMARVCFIICIINLLVHSVLVSSHQVLRRIYGPELITVLYLMLLMHCANLVGLHVTPKYSLCIITLLVGNYVSLCVPLAMISASYTIWKIFSLAGPRSIFGYPYGPAEVTCFYVRFFVVIFIVPLLLLAGGILVDQMSSVFKSTNLVIGPQMGSLQCGVGCQEGHYQHLLYIPLAFLFILHLPLHLFAGRLFFRSSHSSASQSATSPTSTVTPCELTTRYLVTLKLSVTHLIIWLVACLANYICLSVLWHLFTLLCALQSIYILVNFSLTRHFFEVFFKMNEGKGLAKLVTSSQCIPLLTVPNSNNNRQPSVDTVVDL